jgi:Glycosyltransferase Family 4
MRTLILSWEYPPLIEGGLARHVRKLAEGLVQLGVEVHVLTRGDESASDEQLFTTFASRRGPRIRPSSWPGSST